MGDCRGGKNQKDFPVVCVIRAIHSAIHAPVRPSVHNRSWVLCSVEVFLLPPSLATIWLLIKNSSGFPSDLTTVLIG
ncbi:hypothetical protein Y032_0117g660 [Ancylostoma ceylanicum]|uniref:Uncharacterized protein n=1 Tax=Ancylostoma ceylanicum TaxID=53326 RepID=A0A016TBZ0_9BILA|nr:hypothetical protein Y032_0117g660 [Ancylostoma ceylanicum]